METTYLAVIVAATAAFFLWRRSRGANTTKAMTDRFEADLEARQTASEASVDIFSGRVDAIASDGAVRILKDCVVVGPVTARIVEVHGRVEGPICGHERVTLEASAHVDGASITAPKISIAEGAVFKGMITFS